MSKHYLFLFGGAIGDALLGVQLAHALAAAGSKDHLVLVSTRKASFVRQVLDLVPEVAYCEMPRNDIRSWGALLLLALRPHKIVFLEPFQDAVPLWWRVIARVATLLPGSVEVRCQSRSRAVPKRVRTLVYSPKTDNLFSMVVRTLPLLGFPSIDTPTPSLPKIECTSAPARPFVLFHFFAGSYRRSFPLEKVRQLLMAAREAFPRHEFVLTCAHQEESAAREMIEGISQARVCVSPPARELFCLLLQSSVCVGVASGITHVASHLSVSTVALCNLSDPCWLPAYAKTTVQLSAKENCGCHGDKTGVCEVMASGGVVYRCLYDIPTEHIINEMRHVVPNL